MSFYKNIEHCMYQAKTIRRDSDASFSKGSQKISGANITTGNIAADTGNSTHKALSEGIPLGKGMMLKIRTIPYAFTLPHRYHERLVFTLACDHPASRILLNRRVGYLGAATPVRYSILAYLEKPSDLEVKVAGAALNNQEAWSFNTLILLKDLGIGIAKTLEHIAALPIHNPIDFRGAENNGSRT